MNAAAPPDQQRFPMSCEVTELRREKLYRLVTDRVPVSPCSLRLRAKTETYLMKHMSKHTVVEHLVSHQSPQRTESPSIPIRISLI